MLIQEFDLLYSAIDYASIPSYEPKEQINLMELPFGTILEALKSQPSKVVELITKELNISLANDDEKISFWKFCNEQLKGLAELLRQTQPHIKQDSYNSAVWQNLMSENPIEPTLYLIDDLSDKWHLPYADVLHQPFSDCYVALRIAKVKKEYEARVMEHQSKK